MMREGPTIIESIERNWYLDSDLPDVYWATCAKCGRDITYRQAAVHDVWTDSHGSKWSANVRHADCAAPMYGR